MRERPRSSRMNGAMAGRPRGPTLAKVWAVRISARIPQRALTGGGTGGRPPRRGGPPRCPPRSSLPSFPRPGWGSRVRESGAARAAPPPPPPTGGTSGGVAPGWSSGSSPWMWTDTSAARLRETSQTRSVPDGWSAEVMTAGIPRPWQTSTMSWASVATSRSDRSGDWRARLKTWATMGTPAISRSTFRGRRVEWRRAGMTPRTLRSGIGRARQGAAARVPVAGDGAREPGARGCGVVGDQRPDESGDLEVGDITPRALRPNLDLAERLRHCLGRNPVEQHAVGDLAGQLEHPGAQGAQVDRHRLRRRGRGGGENAGLVETPPE